MAQSSSTTPVIQAFNPVEPTAAKILILGSMPGVASLEAGAYYAHPRNTFWPIIQQMLAEQREQYNDRIALLKQHHIALWDVLKECRRPGSLDANIVSDSIVVNDFEGFLARHPTLSTIAFNGKAAEKMFRRHVIKTATSDFRQTLDGIRLVSLPSTSPAMASLSFSEKQQQWQDSLLRALTT